MLSYGEVGRVAFGPWMECFISFLLFIFLLFVLAAYFVLVRDIWTPVVALLLGNPQRGYLVLLFIVVLISPFLVQRTLHALRFNCYLGFCSVSLLCTALCRRAVQKVASSNANDFVMAHVKWGPSSFGDVLFAFPIITLGFLSSFNILSIQEALICPTKKRIRKVIDLAVLACLVLVELVGVSGYIYAGNATRGNILLNCDMKDLLFLIGRIGLGMTVMLATPIITLPCRDSLLEVIDFIMHRDMQRADPEMNGSPMVVNESVPLLHPMGEPLQKDLLFLNPWVHYGSTIGIVSACYIGAVAAPGVAMVWSLCGSFMAFLISFILPTACYIKINAVQNIPEHFLWIWFSWFLLALSCVAATACTIQTWMSIYKFDVASIPL
jgi:amino acid permease